jgi:uncharacterized protein YyaL (SSP411 family)
MIKGYCDAYDAFGEKKFLDAALKATNLLLTNVVSKDGSLSHQLQTSSFEFAQDEVSEEELPKPQSRLGFLEDYCFLAGALLSLYQCTFNEEYLFRAKDLADYALKYFFDKETGMFWFTSDLSPSLFVRKKEIHDNVIPSSNSNISKVLFLLGKLLDNKEYPDVAATMLHNIQEDIRKYPSAFSNWATLLLYHTKPFFEIAITGERFLEFRNELARNYIPNKIFCGAGQPSGLPLLQNRNIPERSLIYVCQYGTCQLPVENTKDALKLCSVE